MAEAFHLSFGLPVVTVRPFNTFGPRQSARAVIPTVITQCLTGQAVLLGNLDPTRDLNYVTNTVDGYLLAASRTEAIGRTINLGSGIEITIRELAQLIAQLTGSSAAIEKDEHRVRPERSEVARLLADSTLAQNLLGWQSAVSLEQGLKLTIDWIQQHIERYRVGTYVV
jgi:dTDP-glucose 4,6-dehydratase